MITKLRDFRIFESKKKNGSTDILICDVQESFKKFFGDKYLEELREYCEGFSRVFQVWDDHNGVEKPDYDFPNQVDTYRKTYGMTLKLEDVEGYFPESMWETVKTAVYNIPDEGAIFETIYGSAWVYIGSRHKWFLCPKELMTLFKSFVRQERKIILVGGAGCRDGNHSTGGECAYDIFLTMKFLGVQVEYNNEFVYSASGSQQQPIKKLNESKRWVT
jgi:hypothetical protein